MLSDTKIIFINVESFLIILSVLDEFTRKIILGALVKSATNLSKAEALNSVSEAAEVSKSTIYKGGRLVNKIPSDANIHPTQEEVNKLHADLCNRELKANCKKAYQRKQGGGRKSLTEKHPDLEEKIDLIIEGNVYGDPCSPLRWCTKSVRIIADELWHSFSIKASIGAIHKILKRKYSLQANRKMECAGVPSEDRNAQYLSQKALREIILACNGVCLSVDMKKKELIGNFAAKGRDWQQIGNPIKVLDHDYGTQKVNPYGIYNIGENTGFVVLGLDKDCANFLLDCFKYWWLDYIQDKDKLPEVICIFCDGGGSNSSRSRYWKYVMQKFSDYTGRPIIISHSSPYTSKWNLVEHRLFGPISENLKACPLKTVEIFQERIKATPKLPVKCVVCSNKYEQEKISDEEFKKLTSKIFFAGWHKDWNYGFLPEVATPAQRELLQKLLDLKDSTALSVKESESVNNKIAS